MRTPSNVLRKLRRIVGRAIAALHQQRSIEAGRMLRRYRHLLEPPHDASLLIEIIPVCHEEEISGNAHGFDARERADKRQTFERA
ncbi:MULTISPECIES: hypothetical protein [Bradyrhizobium]|uniref:Uncharacterized protein n=1 Tax=Bradyrhizobium neotropicale TaxID=1497615 RepID=A0A176YVG8_9BRAD|nr:MULTISPECIES: hypothetical protein [Bradyrhizobium]OAF11709.1 hypothetical protein AXW67_21830 [Bradyrhizobium neotropicale]